MVTYYTLGPLHIRITAYLPDGSVQPVFRIAITSGDDQTHHVTLHAALHLSMRTGEALFAHLPAAWIDGEMAGYTFTVTSGDSGLLEPYTITYGIAGGTPRQTADGLQVTQEMTAIPTQPTEATLTCYFGSGQTETASDALCKSALATPCSPAEQAANAAAYWAARATISTGDARRDWLYHFSPYLTELGTDTRFGAGCCGNFVPLHLGDALFWDSHFMVDGLLHAGALPHAEAMVRWLYRIMPKDGGRPFYWMVHYNGQPLSDDSAFTSVAAHAMTAIRVGMYTQDAEVLRLCNEIVQYVAAYAVAHLFERTPAGWILGAPSTTDVTFSAEFIEGAKNNTFSHLWFLSILAKSVEFAERLGVDYPHTAHCRAITKHYYLEQSETEYLDQKDGRGGERWDSYIPVLCYPTEGQRWIKGPKYHTTRMHHEHYTINLVVQHFKMPWPMCWGAASDLRVGLPDAAEQRVATASDYAYGPGYLCEGMSEGLLSTTQPYLSATGAYLTVQSEQLFYVDFFTNAVKIFANLGRRQELRSISFARLHGKHGLICSACYSPQAVSATLSGGAGQAYDVEIVMPYRLRGHALRVTLNGQSVAYEDPVCAYEDYLDPENRWRSGVIAAKTLLLHDVVPQDGAAIEIYAGTEPIERFMPDQVLLFDHAGLGAQMARILTHAGEAVCRTNNIRRFFAALPQAHSAICTDGVSRLLPVQTEALTAFVQQGGRLMVCYEAALDHAGSLQQLTGAAMTHTRGHRWETTPFTTTLTRTSAVPAALPEQVAFSDYVRMHGTVTADTIVLYRDDAGNPYCTLRPYGAGMVLWMACGRPYLTRREYLATPAWQHWFTAVTRWWLTCHSENRLFRV